jgi:mannose-6-phosphate isomerase-like protein (cupin superfamily)
MVPDRPRPAALLIAHAQEGRHLAAPLISRKGEGKRIMLGPDPWIVRAASASRDHRFDVVEGVVSYLQGPPLHVHQDQDDTMLILRGTLRFQVGDELFDANAGDLISAPKGVPHAFTNVTREPAQLMNMMTPGGLDQLLEDLSALPPGAPDPAALERISRKHRVVVVGPPLATKLGLA